MVLREVEISWVDGGLWGSRDLEFLLEVCWFVPREVAAVELIGRGKGLVGSVGWGIVTSVLVVVDDGLELAGRRFGDCLRIVDRRFLGRLGVVCRIVGAAFVLPSVIVIVTDIVPSFSRANPNTGLNLIILVSIIPIIMTPSIPPSCSIPTQPIRIPIPTTPSSIPLGWSAPNYLLPVTVPLPSHSDIKLPSIHRELMTHTIQGFQ